MNFKLKTCLFIYLCFIITCSQTSKQKLTTEEQDYLTKVNALPLTFILSNEDTDIDKAWERAESWIELHSSTSYEKKVFVGDSTIQTYMPQENIHIPGYSGLGWIGAEFGYFVKRKKTSDNKIGFTVGFNLTRGPWKYPKNFISDADVNCHILAYYIMSGFYFENLVKPLPFNERRHMKYLTE